MYRPDPLIRSAVRMAALLLCLLGGVARAEVCDKLTESVDVAAWILASWAIPCALLALWRPWVAAIGLGGLAVFGVVALAGADAELARLAQAEGCGAALGTGFPWAVAGAGAALLALAAWRGQVRRRRPAAGLAAPTRSGTP